MAKILRLTSSANTKADRWGRPAGRHGASPAWVLAAGGAVLAHGLLLTMVWRVAEPPVRPAQEEAGVPLVLQTVQTLGATSLSNPAVLTPPLRPLAGLVMTTGPAAAAVRIRHVPETARRAPEAQMARSTPEPVPREPGAATPVMTARSTPASAPAPAKAGAEGAALVPALEARIDEAVRQAASMPEAARRQHRQGRAQVTFSYVDGRVHGVRLVSSSESRLLDDAALQAVSRAAYPTPPQVLRGRQLDLMVWVNFRMDA